MSLNETFGGVNQKSKDRAITPTGGCVGRRVADDCVMAQEPQAR